MHSPRWRHDDMSPGGASESTSVGAASADLRVEPTAQAVEPTAEAHVVDVSCRKDKLTSLDAVELDATTTHLNCSENKLAALPDSIRGLRRLRILDGSDNVLTALPASLSECTALEELLLNKYGRRRWSASRLGFWRRADCHVPLRRAFAQEPAGQVTLGARQPAAPACAQYL